MSLRRRTLHTTVPVWRSGAATAAAATAQSSSAAAAAAGDGMPPILWTTHRLNRAQIAKVDGIFHKILWLDIFETGLLNELVNERLDLVLTAKQRRQLSALMAAREAGGDDGGSAAGGTGAEIAVDAGPVLVDLTLAGYDAAAKIKVIKEVRSILGLGLKEAKELVEGAPVVLQKGLKQETADELKVKLEAAGAKIELS